MTPIRNTFDSYFAKMDLYFEVLKDYLQGEGIDFAKHNIQKKDIGNMVTFFGRYLQPDTFKQINYAILMEVLDIPEEEYVEQVECYAHKTK